MTDAQYLTKSKQRSGCKEKRRLLIAVFGHIIRATDNRWHYKILGKSLGKRWCGRPQLMGG